jgi:hypothetical protein
MKTDEDDEYDRIQRENHMKARLPPSPYSYPCQTLTDTELLLAYGWNTEQADSIQQLNYKTLILEGLRNVEREVLKKNKFTT